MHFVEKYKYFLAGVIGIVSLASFVLFHHGFNLGLDFTGGCLLEFTAKDDNVAEKIIDKIGEISSSQRYISNPKTGVYNIKVYTKDIREAQNFVYQTREIIVNSPGVKILRSDVLGQQFSKDILHKSMLSLGISLFSIYLYILYKFGNRLAMGASLALILNCIVTLSVCAFFKMEINLMIISAILTIIGYCINDIVIVFDRIKQVAIQNRHSKMPQSEIVNLAIKLVLKRSIITSSVTSLAICPLLFVSSQEISNFTITVLFGIFIGTIASIILSAIISGIGDIKIKLPREKQNNDDPMRFV